MLIQPRKTLAVIVKEIPECALLADDPRFDMARIIAAEDPELAIKFAYLEHIVRITTPADEAKEALTTLPSEMAENIQALLEGKDALFQESLTVLEQNISAEDLSEMQVPEVALHLEFVTLNKVTERDVFASGYNRLPHVYIGVLDDHCMILYSVAMTFVDGFSSVTGKQINPLFSDDMLASFATQLYWENPDKEIATQTRKPDEEEEEEQEEPVRQLRPAPQPAQRKPVPKPAPKPVLKQAPPQPREERPPPPSMKSLVVEWRSYDHRAYRKHQSREACAGLTCTLQ